MTNIVGNIGFNFTGKLGIYLNGVVIDETTTPDTVYLPGQDLERFFDITNGVLTGVSFIETETVGVSCHFSIYSVDIENNIITPAYKEFDSIIPSQVSVEFSTLVPTGIVNSQLDTSALRIAKLIANDPVLAQKVAGAPYPVGPYNNATFYNYGEMVSYFGKNYILKSLTPVKEVLPTNSSIWYELVITVPDNVAVVATGDDSAYSSSWNGSLLVPTQNSVYDKFFALDAIAVSNSSDISNLQTIKANALDAALTGNPTAPTLPSATNNTGIATTAYVKNNLESYATLIDATLTGSPTAPTQIVSNNSTRIATTAYVKNNLVDTVLSGNPIATTQAVDNNSTRLATTAFVRSQQNRYFTVSYNGTVDRNSDYVMVWSAVDTSSNISFNSTFANIAESGLYMFGGTIKLQNLDPAVRYLGTIIEVNNGGVYRIGEIRLSQDVSGNMIINPCIIYIAAGSTVRLKLTNFASNTFYRIGENTGGTTYWFGYKVSG